MAAAVVPIPALGLERRLGIAVEPNTTMKQSTTEENPIAPVTPPPTDESSKDHASNASELSDLDLDEDEDEVEIEPHHFEGGIPVFQPTMDQFRSFKDFVPRIDKYGMRSGIVKIRPPQEWRDGLPALDEAVKSIRIKNPITQEFNVQSSGLIQQNMEKQRSYNLPQWKKLTEESQHQPPAKRGERRRNQAPVRTSPAVKAANAAAAGADSGSRRPGRPRKTILSQVESADINDTDDCPGMETPPTPTSPALEAAKSESKRGPPKAASRGNGAAKTSTSSPGPKPKGRAKTSGGGAKTIAERRKYNTATKDNEVDEAAFENFDYRFHHNDEFTAERCAELEEKYWKTLTFATPMYGGDMPGSLFDDTTTSWNVAKLDNVLDVLGQKVPGVNTTYLYLGMWKATFAWHLEDMDLYSINYIHFGAPKQWYSISQVDARRFESAMKKIWQQDAKNCSQFLRHKTYLISPERLEKEFNVKVNKIVHNEGEFIITFPYGYHSGYNLGYNCAESVNFATESWLDYGRIAKKCDCEADSVWIDVADIERRLRGEPTPEYYEETDDEADLDNGAADHLLSPPRSVKGRPKGSANKKRKRPEKDVGKKVVKKIRIRINTYQPCMLCPNHIPAEPLLPTDTGKQAHRCCALYTPETSIVVRDDQEVVCNVNKIDRARLDLKCNFCRSKSGSCFQCSARKCTRAFHATCAPPAGVQADFGKTAVYGADGTEYYIQDWDFRCKFHRTRRPKTQTSERLEDSKFIKERAASKKAGDIVQLQYVGGEVFAGTVVENRPDEWTVIVDILPEGDRIEVEWRYLVALHEDDSQRRKPLSGALPLPEHMQQDIGQDGNVGFGPPQQDDVFCDPASIHKWWEFSSAPNPVNPEQARVDVYKPECIWHYLGKDASEAKPHYTEDPANPRHNPRSIEWLVPAPVGTHMGQQLQQKRSMTQSYPNGTNFHALNAISRHNMNPANNVQFRSGKPFYPHPHPATQIGNQQNLHNRPPSSFPNNPYLISNQQGQNPNTSQRRPSQQAPTTPYMSGSNYRRSSGPPSAHSPSNFRGPTPSPLNSPSTMIMAQTYQNDEAHKARLAKYPYIQMSRKYQEEQYPYGYTSPYPKADEISDPYMSFYLSSCDLPKKSSHPQGIEWSPEDAQAIDAKRVAQMQHATALDITGIKIEQPDGSSSFQASRTPTAPMAAMMGSVNKGMTKNHAKHETPDQFMQQVNSEAVRLERQMSRGASIPGGMD